MNDLIPPVIGDDDAPAGDIIEGAAAIADFLNEISADTSSWPERRVYYAAERHYLPIGKLGNQLIASKSRLRKKIALLTGE